MFFNSVHDVSDGEKHIQCDELITNNCSSIQHTGEHLEHTKSDPKTSKIWILEKNITFLKAQHHEMLLALQSEVELLKQRNNDLQRSLVLGLSDNIEVSKACIARSVPFEDVEELKRKISHLQQQLKLAQDTNKLLRKELDAKRHVVTSRHHVVKSTSPLIRKAEQVRASQDEIHNLVINGGRTFNTESGSPKMVPDANFSNKSDSLCSDDQNGTVTDNDDAVSVQSGAAASPPVTELQPASLSPYAQIQSSGSKFNAQMLRLGPIKHQHIHKSPPIHELISNSNSFLEVSGSTHPLPIPSLVGICRSPTRRKMVTSHGFPMDSSLRMNPRALLRSSDETLHRSADKLMEIQQTTTGGNYSHSFQHKLPNNSVTLPALRQSLDHNQANRRRRNLELQKKRVSQTRQPF